MSQSKKNTAIFLDRDGVIIVEKEFQCDPKSIEFIPGSVEGLKNINSKFILAVISNQSGVARDYFTSEDVIQFNQALDLQLKEAGIAISAWYFCPHAPNDNCGCRKPKPGMFWQASEEFDIDLQRSWMIGDKSSDIAAGKAIGAKTILVKTGYAGHEKGATPVDPDFIADNLYEAIKIIESIGFLNKI